MCLSLDSKIIIISSSSGRPFSLGSLLVTHLTIKARGPGFNPGSPRENFPSEAPRQPICDWYGVKPESKAAERRADHPPQTIRHNCVSGDLDLVPAGSVFFPLFLYLTPVCITLSPGRGFPQDTMHTPGVCY